MNRYIAFNIDDERVALPLGNVDRVLRICEITPLPKAPQIVLGIINLGGRIIPVIDTRKRLSLPAREIELNDKLIIARTKRRAIALVIDSVGDILDIQETNIIAKEKILPGLEDIEGVIRLKDGMIVIYDIDKFLSLEEDKILDEAIQHT